MMTIISHRGAAGLAPENTLAGIELAKKYRADIIEIDAQITKDNRLILCHDDNLFRIAENRQKVRELTLREISTTTTLSGHPIPTLDEALEAAGETPLLIDCKGENWTKPLAKQIKKHKGPKPLVASDNFEELLAFQHLCPKIKTFFSELTKPYEAIQTAKVLKFSGVCLQYSLYSPFVYFLGNRVKLSMTMFTVNKPILAWFLHLFYPKVMITTDFPNKIGIHRHHKKSKTKNKPNL
jgi:glycerophosphoryl diester phosphodiesterase